MRKFHKNALFKEFKKQLISNIFIFKENIKLISNSIIDVVFNEKISDFFIKKNLEILQKCKGSTFEKSKGGTFGFFEEIKEVEESNFGSSLYNSAEKSDFLNLKDSSRFLEGNEKKVKCGNLDNKENSNLENKQVLQDIKSNFKVEKQNFKKDIIFEEKNNLESKNDFKEDKNLIRDKNFENKTNSENNKNLKNNNFFEKNKKNLQEKQIFIDSLDVGGFEKISNLKKNSLFLSPVKKQDFQNNNIFKKSFKKKTKEFSIEIKKEKKKFSENENNENIEKNIKEEKKKKNNCRKNEKKKNSEKFKLLGKKFSKKLNLSFEKKFKKFKNMTSKKFSRNFFDSQNRHSFVSKKKNFDKNNLFKNFKSKNNVFFEKKLKSQNSNILSIKNSRKKKIRNLSVSSSPFDLKNENILGYSNEIQS